GKTETVVVAINAQDMASWYSYQLQSDGITRGAYILEEGDYTIRLMESSHFDMTTDTESEGDAYDEVKFTVANTLAFEQDDYSGGQLSSLFTSGLNDNGDAYSGETQIGDAGYGNTRTDSMMKDGESGMTVMTRNAGINEENKSASELTYTAADKESLQFAGKNYSGRLVPTNPLGVVINGFDLSFPEAPAEGDLTFENEVLSAFSYWDNYNVSANQTGARDKTANYSQYFENDDDKGYNWSITKEDAKTLMAGWSQVKGTLVTDLKLSGSNTNQLASSFYMYVSSDNEIKLADMAGVAYDDPMWDTFLNQLTFDELCSLMVYNGWGSVSMDSIDKPSTTAADSPTNYESTHQWTSADVMAATWNPDLAYREGIIMGELILLKGNTEWLGPGADHHRSPFSGRNNEYFSSDGLQGGKICASVVQGAMTRGVVCYLKHCLMNDQETDRGVHFAWCDEQAMREVYTRCFQIGYQEGECNAAMTGYARLGGWCNTSNYNLGVKMYQQEWGTNAPFTTDGWIGWDSKTSPDAMVRAGNQTILTTTSMEYLSGQTNPETGSEQNGGFYIEGETLPDGKTAEATGVYIPQNTEQEGVQEYVISYTQWYWVRGVAKSILYAEANSAAYYNGYRSEEIKGADFTGARTAKFSETVSVDPMLKEGSAVVYEIVEGVLPEGLTLDETSGEISGKPLEKGEFAITVQAKIDGWINKTADYTFTLSEPIEITSNSD
ncbi:MAG: putative Ig domain-containing protein, partial [Parasporobacterium sp.]|nr:putative Ig domain-containing protein [Parasporobacterium sp.]